LEEPGPTVLATEAFEKPKSPERGLLDHVLGILVVPDQKARQTVGSVEVGQDRTLELRLARQRTQSNHGLPLSLIKNQTSGSRILFPSGGDLFRRE
jgi:hypothetical protein